MKKISIIMPVYNSENYVASAIDSILKQSFEEFELILVDDGSTDDSGKICDQYASKYTMIRVIHKQNGGICSARNAGIQVAEGEYIGFCDNDDEFLPGLMEDNYTFANEHNVDIMRFNRMRKSINEEGKVYETTLEIPSGVISSQYAEHYSELRCSNAVWNALYRREIIVENNIKFDEDMRYGNEDLAFNLSVLPYCKVFGFNPKVYYIWIMRVSHSTTAKFDINFFESLLKCMELENSYIHDLSGTLNTLDRAYCLVNQYIYPVCEHLNYSNADLNRREKINLLSKFQNQTIMTKEIFLQNKKMIYLADKKLYIILLLFLEKKYSLLLLVLKMSEKIYRNIRYK